MHPQAVVELEMYVVGLVGHRFHQFDLTIFWNTGFEIDFRPGLLC